MVGVSSRTCNHFAIAFTQNSWCFCDRKVASVKSRPALTLVELLVAMAIIGVVAGLLLGGLVSARESARRTQCQSRLRQIGLATAQYEQSLRHLPPGNLGPKPAKNVTRNRQIYERDHQLMGLIPFLLVYLEETSVADQIGGDMFDIDSEPFKQIWMLNHDTVSAARGDISSLRCPSNLSEQAVDGELLFLNGLYYSKGAGKYLLESAPTGTKLGRFGVTNYLGCMGLFGDVPVEKSQQYLGAIYTRSKTRISQIEDGTTHTLLIGEAVGEQVRGQLQYSYSWMGCGAMPLVEGIGDTTLWNNFSSNHSGIVNFAYADGSVHGVETNVDEQVLLALGGIQDAQ